MKYARKIKAILRSGASQARKIPVIVFNPAITFPPTINCIPAPNEPAAKVVINNSSLKIIEKKLVKNQ